MAFEAVVLVGCPAGVLEADVLDVVPDVTDVHVEVERIVEEVTSVPIPVKITTYAS
ncbi:hypothetical protein OM076_37480 [Solirubrobacter ginsenosidimutans]|uniref:Uncharacterized protein n=1 Tax=Solirubrobacter ginsenosidimutans TaxID=490573 RepID=A0A9X3N0K9_9ACTN|nr:hypothetical protein [Solirubrobacter ginsenosidimutans]